ERRGTAEMAAILARARAELRSGVGSALALALMLGLFGGTVAAATAGARRQVSAYPRFLAVSGAPDAFVISAPAEGEAPIPTVDLARAAKLPQVARAAELPSPFAVATTPNGDVLWDGSLNIVGATGDQAVDWVTRPRILTGRLPDPDRVDEVAVGYRAHQDPRVHIGATIQINLVKPGVNPFEFVSAPPKEDLLPPVDVRGVGAVLLPGASGN